jgi:hypothetical protein
MLRAELLELGERDVGNNRPKFEQVIFLLQEMTVLFEEGNCVMSFAPSQPLSRTRWLKLLHYFHPSRIQLRELSCFYLSV